MDADWVSNACNPHRFATRLAVDRAKPPPHAANNAAAKPSVGQDDNLAAAGHCDGSDNQ
jgi:hypothetical protein